MIRLFARLTLAITVLLQFSATVHAGPLDDYYLQQFGETKNIQLQKAILSAAPDAEESARCGMPLKHGLQRDWNLLEQTTQKVLAKQLAAPVLAGEATYISSGGHFKVHFATTGTDAPPLADLNSNGIPDWVETVAATFENVYANYSVQGYQTAPTSPAGVPYDLYLRDLAPQGYYGLTNSIDNRDNQFVPSSSYPNGVTSYMELDNNFTDSIYRPATFTPLQSLQITAAHEYHHAIQYGYNIFFDVWYAEATSTWMEDEQYDGVNQLYSYIPAWFNNSTTPLDLWDQPKDSNPVSTGAGYGRWIFNRFLSEKHGPVMIRNVWEKVGTLPSPGNNTDIPMLPVLESVLSSATYATSLGNDFFGFAKRVYTRAWTTHTSDISKIHPYTPFATYKAYPVNSSVTAPAPPSITLPHYSFAYYKFTPTPTVTSLKISINKSSGIQTSLFKNGGEITVDANGTSTAVSYVAGGLGASDEVVLLIANTTGLDGHEANFSTDGSLEAVTEPTPASSSTVGSSNSCFIATAAYGSYLHPQVQLLRNFRDEYLLTNTPGRAFVKLYYRFSPPLADLIARHPLLRGATRLLLTPLIVAIGHPAASGATLTLAIIVLYRPLRRRYLARIATG